MGPELAKPDFALPDFALLDFELLDFEEGPRGRAAARTGKRFSQVLEPVNA